MNEYAEALSELASLPERLQDRLDRCEREVDAERKRREREVDGVAREHEAVVVALEAVLAQARSEGLGSALVDADGVPSDRSAAGDPIEYARQLVERLEQALERYVYTRDALGAEKSKLEEDERRREAEERHRREAEELRQRELKEMARRRATAVLVTLGVAAAVGIAIGFTASPAALALSALPAVAALIFWMTVLREK